jgi:hypothetical protein
MALQIFHARILAIQLPSFVQLQWEKLAENGEILLASNQVAKLCTEEHYQVFQQALQTVVVCVSLGLFTLAQETSQNGNKTQLSAAF